MEADTVVFAKRIYSDVLKPEKYYTALAIKEDRIYMLGDKSKIEKLIDPKKTTVFNFPDDFVLPGFNDAHCHIYALGQTLQQIDLTGINSEEELIHTIQRYVKEKEAELSENSWIIGVGWDNNLFDTGAYPTLEALNLACPDYPLLLIRACRHVGIANSTALNLSNIDEISTAPEGGIYERDEEGKLTGVLKEYALFHLQNDISGQISLEERVQIIKHALVYCTQFGITSVQTNDPYQFDAYQHLLKSEGTLPCRVYWVPVISELPNLKNRVYTGYGGNEFKVGAIKLFADGSLGGETAALRQPYCHKPHIHGTLLYSDEDLKNYCIDATKNRFQLWIHVIGDLAAEKALDAIENITKTNLQLSSESVFKSETNQKDQEINDVLISRDSFKIKTDDLRPVLVHTQVLAGDLLKRMKKIKAIAAIQPLFIATDQRWAEQYLGKSRMEYAYAWKTIIENQIKCCASSDAPIEPINPFFGIHAAVHRTNLENLPSGGWYVNEAVDIATALNLYTSEGAFASFEEKEKGKLEPKMLADFCVVDRDPYTTENIKDTLVKYTLKGGVVTYKVR